MVRRTQRSRNPISFWIALAATQWQCGRLEERVKTEALQIISEGTDLQRWHEQPRLLARRKVVLDRLRTRLEGPQLRPTRIAKRFVATCDWDVDEIVAFRLRSGNFAVFRVVGYHTDQGGRSPKCELFDWSDRTLPSVTDLMSVNVRRGVPPRNQLAFIMCQMRKSDLPAERVFRLGFKIPWAQNPSGGRDTKPKRIEDLMNPAFLAGAISWRKIDQELEKTFGLV